MDAHEVEFYQRVRAGYLEMAGQDPKRWAVVDAGREWKSVQADLQRVILGHLAR
jgi:thymidylate kinase